MMSGGVDSSVAAALLAKRSFNVVGVFMKNWDGGGECQWVDDERDARRVAAKIGIPFYVMNFEKEYRKRVFDPFIEGIRQGITPNPDVFCNTHIKFGVFLERALSLGADYVATGHYAKVKETGNWKLTYERSESAAKAGSENFHLLRAKDEQKDQTYFLYRLNQFQLSKTIFPIGNYLKSEVRAMAKEFGLPTYNKPDSQGICFVGQAPFAEFLSQFVASKEGAIVDKEGAILGKHQGVSFYTIGQRKGMAVGGNEKPLFIARKDNKTNTLTVVSGDDASLYTKHIRASDVHWIGGAPPKSMPIRCRARFRHQQAFQGAFVSTEPRRTVQISFSKPQRAVTPGQSVVFYKGREALGGGIII